MESWADFHAKILDTILFSAVVSVVFFSHNLTACRVSFCVCLCVELQPAFLFAKGISRSGLKQGILDDRSGLICQVFRMLDEDDELWLASMGIVMKSH